jgi:hypothetical protein
MSAFASTTIIDQIAARTPPTRRSRFNANTLINTTTDPTSISNVGRSANPTDAIPIAVGGIKYNVIVARLKSTCWSTNPHAR